MASNVTCGLPGSTGANSRRPFGHFFFHVYHSNNLQIEYTQIVLFPRTIFSCDNISKRKHNVNITYLPTYVTICKYANMILFFSLSITLQQHILWTLIIFLSFIFRLTYNSALSLSWTYALMYCVRYIYH